MQEQTHPNGVVTRSFALAGPGLLAAVTTRAGGRSSGPYASCNLGAHVGDDPDLVQANRDAVAQALGVGPLTIAGQEHGRRVALVDDGLAGAGHDVRRPEARLAGTDALVTTQPGVALAVLAADCATVVLADPQRGVLAVAHAGRRGVVVDVVGATVAAMAEVGGCRPAELRAGVGPCIGTSAYEIDGVALAEVEAAFGGALLTPTTDGRACFDLRAAVVRRLREAGVPEEGIEVAPTSTDRDPALFSDRAARPCGRFALVAALRGPTGDRR